MQTPSALSRIQLLKLPHLPTTGASTIVRRVAWDLRTQWISVVVTPNSHFSTKSLLEFLSSTAANKPVWLLVVADGVEVDVKALRDHAIGSLYELRVLVLQLQRFHSRVEYDQFIDLEKREPFALPTNIEDTAEASQFERLCSTTVNTPKQYLFLWGLRIFLRQYDKIISHLHAIGQDLQRCPDLPQLSHLVKLCCIFGTYDLAGVPLESLPDSLSKAPLGPLSSVLLLTSTTVSAPVTDRETLAILFCWAEKIFCVPDLRVERLPVHPAAACVEQWLVNAPPASRVQVAGQRSTLQEICFPLLISRQYPHRFSPFVELLFESDTTLAEGVLIAMFKLP